MTKPRIMFLHGFLGDSDEFRHIGRVFESTHHVVYWSVTESGLPRFARNDRWHLVGYSMGGRLALNLAHSFPERVSRVTIISSTPGIEGLKERRQRLLSDRALARSMRMSSMREFLAYWYRQSLFQSLRAHPCFHSLVQRRAQQSVFEQADIVETFSPGVLPSFWDALQNFTMPIHIICGSLDSKYLEIGRRMLGLNTNSDLTVVAKAGHVVHWEDPRAVIERISRVEYPMAIRRRV